MTTKVIAQFNLSNGRRKDGVEFFKRHLPVTRKYRGCLSLNFLIDHDDPNNIVITSCWQSAEHHKAYLEFRKNEGTLDQLSRILKAEPVIEYFDEA